MLKQLGEKDSQQLLQSKTGDIARKFSDTDKREQERPKSSSSAHCVLMQSSENAQHEDQRKQCVELNQPQQCQPSKKRKLIEKFKGNDIADLKRQIEHEVNAYIHFEFDFDSYGGYSDSLLDFWAKNELSFPNLSILARSYLCISASSVAVECMFSTCGFILNSKRCSMTLHRASMLSFIHDNYKNFVPISKRQKEKDRIPGLLE